MTYEDFTTYTEVDPENDITVATNKLTGVLDRDYDAHVYKDFGVDHFNGFEIKFEIRQLAGQNSSFMGHVCLANSVNDVTGFSSTDVAVLNSYSNIGASLIRLARGNFVAQDTYEMTTGTIYYCTLKRAPDSDTITLEIRTGSHTGTLVDTLSLSGFGTATKYRYLYGMNSYNTGHSGYSGKEYTERVSISEVYPILRSVTHDGEGGVTHIEYINTFRILGNYLYAAVYGDGTVTILNISDPDSVTEAGYISCPDAHDIQLKEVGDTLYAFVVTYATCALKSFNVTNPSSISQLDTINVGGTNGMYLLVEGDYAYVTVWDSVTAVNNCIKIYNISDPTDITYVSQVCHNGSTCLMRKPWCPAKKGNYIYLPSTTDSRINIFNVSNINSPSYDSYFQSTAVGIDPIVRGNYLITTNSDPGEVIIWDISTPNSPSEVSRTDFDIWYHMALDDLFKYLYVRKSGDDGIKIIDVSNKSVPIFKTSILKATYDYFEKIHFNSIIANNRLYSYSYTNDRLFIFDIHGVKAEKTKASSIGLAIQETNTKASSVGLRVADRKTKASSVGLTVQETNTKASSIGLAIQETNTKASSIGLAIQETNTKASSVGLTVQETNTKASSVGLTVQETNTKASSIGMSIKTEEGRVSILGITIVKRFTKQSSIGISLTGANTKESSIGVSIFERNVKASSVGLSIIEQKVKASSVGIQVVTRETKASSVSLTVFDTPVKNSSIGLDIKNPKTKESSIGIQISGTNTKGSSIGVYIEVPARTKGLFYGKLGDTILESVMPENFRISKEINKIPSFEFEVANSEANRTAIAANPTALFKIYWQHHAVENHIFTGIINADGIEYVSLSNIRITGFASYVKLGWPLFKHLNAEDAEPVNKVFVFDGNYTDYTDNANNDSEITLDSMDSATNWEINNGMTDITVNAIIKKEGSGALNLIKANTGTPYASIFKSISSTNLASCNVKVWLYIKDIVTKNKISRAEINLLDSDVKVSEWYFPVSGLSVGWNLLVVDTESTPNYTENPDLTDICEIQLGVNTNLATDTYAEGDVISDYYHYFTLQIPVSFSNIDHALYIGEANPFWGLQIKYSTSGIPAGSVVVIEFSKGSGIWATLDVLDETNAFTEDAGIYDIIIPHPPSDWARNTVNGISKFWLRWRVVNGAYTTSPTLDKIHTVNVDVYRVFYYETSARAILLDVLNDTEYSMDTVDTCPEDEINLLAEYESPLRVMAAIPAALTWTDTDGSKKSYQWWIDDAKKVHMKQKRGTTHLDDITGDLTIFNNLIDYFNISNRLFGFSKRDGLSQIRAIIENTASQATHALREIAVPKNEIGKYATLKESLEKDIAYSKEPMQRIKGSVTTEFWGQRGYEVGDSVTLHQGEWVVDEGTFQIVKVDIGPILTQLNLGISREHLEGLKANLKRAFDINNIQMHGSTTIFSAGPETMNYERKADSSVFPAKLKIDIPSEVTKTHKMLLSWTVGNYRASVNEETGTGSGHDHGGHGGAGGAIGSGNVSAGGASTPYVLPGGDFIPKMLSEAHIHHLDDTLYIQHSSGIFSRVVNDWVHGLNHRHSMGGLGGSTSNAYACTSIGYGTSCTQGACVDSYKTYFHNMALAGHSHSSSSYTGYSSPSGWIETLPASYVLAINPTVLSIDSNQESPAHLHDGVYEGVHPHLGVYEPPHNDHLVSAEPAHDDHLIAIDPGGSVDIDYGIHEEAPGTVLELLVNSEKVNEYSGDQTEIRIDGYLTSGTNTIELQPIAAETGKKGGVTIWGSGILFYEPKKF